MTPLEKLSLMVFGTLGAIWVFAWVVSELIDYLIKE